MGLQQRRAGSAGTGSAFAEGDIKWLISVFGCGETGSKGFKQCEWNVSGDKHGWTVGGWSITQKGNFKRLGEEYMPKAGFSADICQQIANADFGNRSQSDGDKGPIEALVSRLTNKSGTDAQGEDVQKFVKATSDMFAHTWYLSAITLLNNLGIKTRLGMATVIRAIGWTGGDMNALVNKPTILLHAARKITAEHGGYDEMARNMMALGDEEKEKKFVQMFWEGHKDTCAALFGKTSGHGWINEANDYLKYLQEGNLNPDSMNILGNNITYGQLLSSYAPYESIFMPLFLSVGAPPGTAGPSGPAGEGLQGVVKMAEDLMKYATLNRFKYVSGGAQSFKPNPLAGQQGQGSGFAFTHPKNIPNTVGMDCSGFVFWVYHELGIMNHWNQSQVYLNPSAQSLGLASGYTARLVDVSQVAPGDILVRKDGDHGKHGHVGIYIGNGMQIDYGMERPWGTKNPHQCSFTADYRYTHAVRIEKVGGATT